MNNSSLVTVSAARITGTIFRTPNSRGKNIQPNIAVVGFYFASYNSTFQKRINASVI